MNRAVIISHPSEIIRKGLVAVLEGETTAKIISTAYFEELQNLNYAAYSEVFLMLPVEFNGHQEMLDFRSKVNCCCLVGIGDWESSDEKNHLFEHTYSLYSDTQKLIDLVNRFLTQEEDDKSLEELSVREKEVLRLIARGLTNKAIADSLFISTHTVISHRKNITDKLGIKSIPGLTVYAIIQKIIDPDDISSGKLL